jgi:hypothetical protein
VEKVRASGVGPEEHKDYLHDLEREELGMKGGGVVGPMDEDELLFAILQIRRTQSLDHLWE